MPMRSPRGFAAAAVFLLALPVAFLYQLVGGAGVEALIHAFLGAGSVLMSFAVFNFKTPKWITWVGCLSIGTLAAIFVVQGASELTSSAMLTYLAYRVLGQRVEGWLVDLFLLWCIAVWLFDSRGKTRIIGFAALSMVVCVEVYANGLSVVGKSISVEAPGLKLLFLPLLGWVLLESWKANPPPVVSVLPSAHP
ncbi:MAG: hypothetical protein ND807_10330 [Vicinamibacterales bacterium]|nr:hypothetical protein [Vicinamibacterales bacterium]